MITMNYAPDSQPRFCPASTRNRPCCCPEMLHPVDNTKTNRGLTLVEVMMAMALFAILMAGALTAVLQTRRMAENNIGMAVARTVAQGIIEQARLEGGTLRKNPAPTHLPLRFIGGDDKNFAAISQSQLEIGKWTPVGALNPLDPAKVLGVLLDVEQRDASGNVIRPARYMPMEVNFRIIANEEVRRHLVVAIQYKWESPANRVAAGSDPNWGRTREIQTAIAYASTL
jgi:prepilin-type N-terminal cleavage/methylation domain-containing protein